MLIIKNNQICAEPLIDILHPSVVHQEIGEAVKEYILRNRQPVVVSGEKAEAFHVSGFAEHHHKRLAEYLKYLRCGGAIDVASGFFCGHPCQHYWLKFDDIIIDVTIKQFADKINNLTPTMKFFIDRAYFISNNTQNIIYCSYQESVFN